MASQNSPERARALVDQILREASDRDHIALLARDADPETVALLDLLPKPAPQRARQHLRSAQVWRGQQAQKMTARLDAAKTAFDGLDISLARAILRKVDSSLLSESDSVRYDELLLTVEARAVELEAASLLCGPDQKETAAVS